MDMSTAVETLQQHASGPCGACRGAGWLDLDTPAPRPCTTCLPYGARTSVTTAYDGQRVQHVWTKREGVVVRSWKPWRAGFDYCDVRYDTGSPGIAWVGDLVLLT